MPTIEGVFIIMNRIRAEHFFYQEYGKAQKETKSSHRIESQSSEVPTYCFVECGGEDKLQGVLERRGARYYYYYYYYYYFFFFYY